MSGVVNQRSAYSSATPVQEARLAHAIQYLERIIAGERQGAQTGDTYERGSRQIDCRTEL